MKDLGDMTLRHGLEKFRSDNDENLTHYKKGISAEAETFFLSHDIAHVLFGCDISLFGEGAVKLWTIFGTTLGFRDHIKAYRSANAYELSKKFTLNDFICNFFKLMLSIASIIFRAKSMKKLWPWAGFEAYLDIPISEIREEFNIQVV